MQSPREVEHFVIVGFLVDRTNLQPLRSSSVRDISIRPKGHQAGTRCPYTTPPTLADATQRAEHAKRHRARDLPLAIDLILKCEGKQAWALKQPALKISRIRAEGLVAHAATRRGVAPSGGPRFSYPVACPRRF
jgi:hypothetical protein